MGFPNPDTPLGITLGTKNNANINSNVIPDMKNLGIRWLRWQPYWNAVETSKGVYSWGNLDSVVSSCNSLGINLLLTVLFPPSWWILASGLPSPQGTLQYAQAMCSRYDGNHGHGHMEAIELGNEDYDMGSGTPYQPLADTMNACYPKLKAAYPNLVIGPGCTLQRNTSHIQSFWGGMWSAASGHFDYVNSHFYTCIPGNGPYDPSDGSVSNVPNFNTNWQTIQTVNANNGHANFPIWITECGFAVNTNFGYPYPKCVASTTTQKNYLNYILTQAKNSGYVNKVFLFNLSYLTITPTNGVGTSEGMSLYQGVPGSNGFQLPAYAMVKAFPSNWGGGTQTPTVTQDLAARVRVQPGTNGRTVDMAARVRVATAGQLQSVLDLAARIRIAGIQDTFVRPNQTGWGTASNGETWVQANGTAALAIAGNQGTVKSATSVNTLRLGTQTPTDADALLRVSISRVGDFVALTLRDQDLNNFYRLRQTGSQLQLVSNVANVFTILNYYAFAMLINTLYWMRFRVSGDGTQGNNLFGKVWQDGTAEPPDWLVTKTATTINGPGQVGIAVSLTNTSDTVTCDSYSVGNAPVPSVVTTARTLDLAARVRVATRSNAQQLDLAARLRIVDPFSFQITSSAAKQPPVQRRFPKS